MNMPPLLRPFDLPVGSTPDWTGAACADHDDPDLWFPASRAWRHKRNDSDHRAVEAKQVCAGCPLRDACLEYALTGDVQYGVWGGLDEDQRDELRRRSA